MHVSRRFSPVILSWISKHLIPDQICVKQAQCCQLTSPLTVLRHVWCWVKFHPHHCLRGEGVQQVKNDTFTPWLSRNQWPKKSSYLTTFSTPFGRYRYKRLPMGISSAPELYQQAMNDIYLVRSRGLKSSWMIFWTMAHQLKYTTNAWKKCWNAAGKKLRLNGKKTRLCTDSVEYIRHKLTERRVEISNEKVQVVLNMPEPQRIDQVHTLLGMVTYTCKFLPNLSGVTEPLRQLLKESNKPDFAFHFDEPHKEAFDKLKKIMTTTPVLKYYILTQPITVSCDASQSGLGAVIIQ